jgi:hypothetical protein
VGLIALIVALLTAWSIYGHYTDPERIRAFAEDYLHRYLRGGVTIGSAEFSWFEGIRLFDVAVAEPGHSAGASVSERNDVPVDSVFTCRELKLVHNRLAALRDGFAILSVAAFEPTCTIIRDAERGRTNLSELLRPQDDSSVPLLAAGTPLPIIELRDARVRVLSQENGQQRLVEDLTMTVRALPAPNAPRVYNIVWQEEDRTAGGHSQIDLRTGHLRNIRGGLPWMSIEAVMVAVNARYDGASAWCSLLGLDGTVRAKDYNLVGSTEEPAIRSATIELSNARISIPVLDAERDLPSEERYLRFEDVNGEIQLTSVGMRADFSGSFHGSSCTVTADLRSEVKKLATLGDVAFDARIVVEGLTLPRRDPVDHPAEARFIDRWPRLAAFYRDYDPHGTADLEIDAQKNVGADEPIRIRRALLTALSGDASCRFFPYRGYGVTGTVEYTPDGVFVRDLRGHHDGGVVSIDAHLEAPTIEAAKKVTIKGTGIPIDGALVAALPAQYRRIQEQFGPEGAIDVEVELTQPRGTASAPAPWKTGAEVRLLDVAGAYAAVPYPVENISGTILVDRDRLRIEGLMGRSGDAVIGVQGQVVFSEGAASELELTVDARDVAFDEALRAALPESVGHRLRSFHPRGRFDAQIALQLSQPDHEVTHAVQVTLKDVSIRPNAMPVDITQLTGELNITPATMTLEGLTGRYRDATVSAEGTIALSGRQQASHVLIRSRDLRCDDALRATLPAELKRTLADWRIDGPIQTETVISHNPGLGAAATSVSTTVELSGTTVGHPMLPETLDDVQACVTIDALGVRAKGVTARYGTADVHLSLDISNTEGSDVGTFTVSMTGAMLDSTLRDLLPARMRTAWDAVEPSGSLDVHVSTLQFHRPAGADRRVWSVEGYVEFADVALKGLADIQRMSGTLTGSGAPMDKLGGTSLRGQLDVTKLAMWGQPLEHVSSPWSYARTAEGQGMLVLDAIRGRMHEGDFNAHVETTFDKDRADYNLRTTLHQIQIEPLVAAAHTTPDGGGERAHARGLADAHLYLSGRFGHERARRGGGRFEVIEGQIYRLPLILAILHVLNLSVPDQNAFDNVRAEFYVMGNRIEIEDLVLRGNVLALKGTGSVTLPDRGVDLNLVTVNPNRWANVPVLTDLVEATSRQIVELHVTGPLSQPTVRPRPFRGVTDEVKRLFRRKKPKVTRPASP